MQTSHIEDPSVREREKERGEREEDGNKKLETQECRLGPSKKMRSVSVKTGFQNNRRHRSPKNVNIDFPFKGRHSFWVFSREEIYELLEISYSNM